MRFIFNPVRCSFTPMESAVDVLERKRNTDAMLLPTEVGGCVLSAIAKTNRGGNRPNFRAARRDSRGGRVTFDDRLSDPYFSECPVVAGKRRLNVAFRLPEQKKNDCCGPIIVWAPNSTRRRQRDVVIIELRSVTERVITALRHERVRANGVAKPVRVWRP